MNTSLWFYIYTHSKEVNRQYPKYLLPCISNAFFFLISLKGHIKIDLKNRLIEVLD